jgi:hypothetical protein
MEWWQDPAFLTQITAILAILVTLVGGLLYLWRWAKSHDRVHAKLEGLPEIVDDSDRKLSALLAIEVDRTPNLWDKVKAYSPAKSNPYDSARKNALLDKMRSSTIKLQEARELEAVLNEDLVRARAEGAGAMVAIIAILGALGALIYLLTRE